MSLTRRGDGGYRPGEHDGAGMATLTGRELQVARLDYAGDFNGERSYTLSLESSGPVVSA